MTEFSELMQGLARDGASWTVTVNDDWLQGRTIYGGLAGAFCLEATLRQLADLPPLRSAQFAFIGPATGGLRVTPTVLRRGKSTVFVAVDLHGDDGLATRATFCFGAARASKLGFDRLSRKLPNTPEACPSFFENAPPTLRFLAHIEGRLAGGNLPFSGSREPTSSIWLRHRDPALTPSLVSLLALADAPPPAILTTVTVPGPISTMTWEVDMLTDRIATRDGWWLVETTSDTAADGYSSQTMTVWNTDGRPVMANRQNVAAFI